MKVCPPEYGKTRYDLRSTSSLGWGAKYSAMANILLIQLGLSLYWLLDEHIVNLLNLDCRSKCKFDLHKSFLSLVQKKYQSIILVFSNKVVFIGTSIS